MRKKILIALLSTTVLFGCSGNSTANQADSDQQKDETSVEGNDKETENTSQTVNTEVTKDNFRSFPVTEETWFGGSAADEGFVIDGCTSKDNVIVIPEEIFGSKVVGIDDYALSGLDCEALVLPDSVKWIGEQAFTGNMSMKYIYLGTDLKRIGQMAFNSCLSLKEVVFPEGMETIEFCFVDDVELEKVYIPASVNNILVGISSGCPKLAVYTPAGSYAEEKANAEGLTVINE